jgi:hypothetical protein
MHQKAPCGLLEAALHRIHRTFKVWVELIAKNVPLQPLP